MFAIGLEYHLAIKFFSKVYCWLPSHLTVRGLAEDLISAEYDRRKATGGLAGENLSKLLVDLGFRQSVVDDFVKRITDLDIVHHRGLRNVAFDLIDCGILRWAADRYTRSDEPEDDETKPKGSTDRGGRGPSGQGGQGGQGGQSGQSGQSGDRKGGGRGNGRGGGRGHGRRGDDSDHEEGGRTRANAMEEEEKFITLYHGTTAGFAADIFHNGIDLSEGRKNTDFAIKKAFYLGNNELRAKRWARDKAIQNHRNPVPAYLAYTVNMTTLDQYQRKVFNEPDAGWKQPP